jgi:hypothetical protein
MRSGRAPSLALAATPNAHMGTDFPYEAGDALVRAVDYISDSGLGPDDAHAILDHNAMALLGHHLLPTATRTSSSSTPSGPHYATAA